MLLILILAAGAFFGRDYFLKKADAGKKQAQVTEERKPQAPVVVLHTVEMADLSVGKEYIGKVEPVQTVSLRPQISGTIKEVHFKEGSTVKAGDLLFSLDDSQFRTNVALRKAELAKAEANHDRALKYSNRLKSADSRSVSASDREMAESDLLQAQAMVQQAKATLQLAQIDLGYTKITSPIDGRVGKALWTKGNYVTPAGTTPLTNIVQINPIRVTFSLPDRDYMDQFEAFRGSEASVYDAVVRLANGDIYPGKGVRDFENNVMDDRTGTIQVSLRFENGEGTLVPGAMVRLEAKPAKSRVVPVIPQSTVMSDGQGDFVYTVDGENTVHAKRISLGSSTGDMVEVVSGLERGERIVLLGLQSIRPEIKVSPIDGHNGGTKTPAEMAMESGYDLKPLSSDKTGGN